MRYSLEAFGRSDVGNVRKNNEDNLFLGEQILEQEHSFCEGLLEKTDTDKRCYAVFDGVGGAEDGQVASFLAAKEFSAECGALKAGGELTEAFFETAAHHMNDAVYQEGQRRRNNMGTTAVMIGFQDERFYVANVGDSRAYRFRGGKLVQVSIDHSEQLSQEQRALRKPRLTQCIGRSEERKRLEPYIASGVIEKGDCYLLCSDGVTDMVVDEQISDVLRSCDDPRACVDGIVSRALQNGGRDNITVIVIKIGERM